MFAPRSGQPLSTHARNAAKYTLYLLFIHRERFLRVYSLKWMYDPPGARVSRAAPPRRSVMKSRTNSCINTRHFVDVSNRYKVCKIRCKNKLNRYMATMKRVAEST